MQVQIPAGSETSFHGSLQQLEDLLVQMLNRWCKLSPLQVHALRLSKQMTYLCSTAETCKQNEPHIATKVSNSEPNAIEQIRKRED